MQRTLIASAAVVTLASAPVAFAQQATPPPASSTTTMTTTSPNGAGTMTSTPPTTGTTTTTQAYVEGPPSPVVAQRPVVAETTEVTTSPINRPLLATGFVLFGGTYLASVIVAAESNHPSDNPNLYYPVAGPWMDLAQRNCTSVNPCSGETGNKTLLVLDGITQGVGALAMVTSLFIPEKKSRHWFLIGNDKINAAPTTVGTGYGFAAAGRF